MEIRPSSELPGPSCRELRGALDRAELSVQYQPTIRLLDGMVTGLEALVRWHHPRLGLLPAAAFVRLAEVCGLIHDLDEWVRRTVFTQVQQWQEDVVVTPGFRVAVNLSAVEITRPDLASGVIGAIQETGVDPIGITFELTETCAIGDLEAAKRSALALRDVGVRLALDDFGSQFATFELLRSLPFGVLKLDRALVEASDTNLGRAMVLALLDVGRELESIVVAEGIETSDEARLARDLGCHEGQGFLWTAAVTADEAERLLTVGVRT